MRFDWKLVSIALLLLALQVAVLAFRDNWIYRKEQLAAEFIEQKGGLVVWAEVESSQDTNFLKKFFEWTRAGKHVVNVHVSRRPKFKDEDLTVLQDFPHLRRLQIWDCPSFDGSGLKYVSVSRLALLSIANTGLTEENAKLISRFVNLEELFLDRCDLSGQFISTLSNLQSLKHFKLGSEKLTADLSQLATLGNLNAIEIDAWESKGSINWNLSVLPKKLKILIVSSKGVDDAWLQDLSTNESLERICIISDTVTSNGLIALAKIPTLEVLDVYGGSVTESLAVEFQRVRPDVYLGGKFRFKKMP
jgi:hypothetical protein